MKLVLTGIIENISTRVDGSIKFTFGSQEIDSQMGGNLLQLRGKFIKALLTDNNITELEAKVIEETPIQDGTKTKSHSQRLRAVLYRVWEQSGLQIPFDDFYRTKMEGHITDYKNMLD